LTLSSVQHLFPLTVHMYDCVKTQDWCYVSRLWRSDETVIHSRPITTAAICWCFQVVAQINWYSVTAIDNVYYNWLWVADASR